MSHLALRYLDVKYGYIKKQLKQLENLFPDKNKYSEFPDEKGSLTLFPTWHHDFASIYTPTSLSQVSGVLSVRFLSSPRVCLRCIERAYTYTPLVVLSREQRVIARRKLRLSLGKEERGWL